MMTCYVCARRLVLRGTTLEGRPLRWAALVAVSAAGLCVRHPLLSLFLVVLYLSTRAKAQPIEIVLDGSITFLGDGFPLEIPLRTVTSIERDGNAILVVHDGKHTRITIQPELHDLFVRHAVARMILARMPARSYRERRVLEAMLAHGAEAVVFQKHGGTICMTMAEALAAHPRHPKVYVRRELVGTYRTPHDPRFVLVTPR